ncbi:UNVERIFIED_CONTAM: hypothetical protein FKN15_020493 [Acipenser sinensis]
MDIEVDLIEFKVPVENNKTLFVWNILPKFSEAEIYNSVDEVFSKYGALYSVRVCRNAAVAEPGYYAIVKFYSAVQASKAQVTTNGKGIFQESPLKVRLCTKQNTTFQQRFTTLRSAKCQELANYYLGFNGWSNRIVTVQSLRDNTLWAILKDHRWRACPEEPPADWCGRCEEDGHKWAGCPYAQAQASASTPVATVPPGSPSSQEIWEWLMDAEGDLCSDLPLAIDALWYRDGEQWEAWERQHHPASLHETTAMVLRYLAQDMAEIPAFQVPEWVPSCEPEGVELPSTEPEGEEPMLRSPEREEEELPSPELEGEELQAQPPVFFWGEEWKDSPPLLSEEPAAFSLLSEEPAAFSLLSEEPAAFPQLSEEPAEPPTPAFPLLSEEPAGPPTPALPPLSEELTALPAPALPPLSEEPAALPAPALPPLSEEPAALPAPALPPLSATPAVGRAGSATSPSPTPAVGRAGSATSPSPTPAVGRAGSATSPNPTPAVRGAGSATRGRRAAVLASATRGRRAAVPASSTRGAGAGSTSCGQQGRGTPATATLAGGSCNVGHAQGCLPRIA